MMNNLVRGTTPNLTFKSASDLDLSTLVEVWFTLAQKGNKEITHKLSEHKVLIDAEEKTITISLNQEETLFFTPDIVEIQLRCLDNQDISYASDIYRVHMDQVLKGGVINAVSNDNE